MSEVTTSQDISKVKQEFDVLLENLAKVLKEVRPRTNILNTKLGKIKKDLSNIERLDKYSRTKVSEIAIKFNTINSIFSNDIQYNKKELAKIIEGKHCYQLDSNEGYNDIFFELSMGIRFLLASKGNKPKINLDSDCDVIVNDTTAIECKYIHSASNLIKNITKANNQINARVNNGQAKEGFIALDLSHICPRDKVDEFTNYTFDKFLENYKYLECKRKISGDIANQILANKHFRAIINSYIMSEVETALYGELGFSYKMGPNTLAIIFQSINSFCFEYKTEVIPLTTRGMSYFLNKQLTTEVHKNTQQYIHNLAVGV